MWDLDAHHIQQSGIGYKIDLNNLICLTYITICNNDIILQAHYSEEKTMVNNSRFIVTN